ncbi:MAG: flagellar motor switch protein FliN [Phycisphaerales bacterium]|nr:flagellar motor switch protein FliN [Phycisphaerales bacterium]
MPDDTDNAEGTNEATPESEQPDSEQSEAVDPQGDTDEASAAEPQASVDGEDASTEGGDQAEAEMSDSEAEALAAAMSAIGRVQGIADSAGDSASAGTPFNEPVFKSSGAGTGNEGLDLLSDVNLNVRIELGRTKMFVEDVLKLNEGAVVELDKLAGDPVDVYVNDRHVAKGEVLVLNENFCVRINEIVSFKED